jgi:hypothetical protein
MKTLEEKALETATKIWGEYRASSYREATKCARTIQIDDLAVEIIPAYDDFYYYEECGSGEVSIENFGNDEPSFEVLT